MLDYEAYARAILVGLVKHPDAIKVRRSDDEGGILLTLDLHKEDMGRVIGKAGITIKGVRSILHAAGMQRQARVSLKINEPEGSTHPSAKLKEKRPDTVAQTRELDDVLGELAI